MTNTLTDTKGPSFSPVSTTILVIDDDEITVALVTAVLQAEGYTVVSRENGVRAVEFLKSSSADVILLDLVMPEMDGFQTLEWIREQPSLDQTPVICVTNLDDAASLDRVFCSNASDYVGKPIRPAELLARIRLHLRLVKKENDLKEALSDVQNLRQHFFKGELEHPEIFAGIITQNAEMMAMFRYLEAVGPSARPVLIAGETGVGKELVARAVHDLSDRQGDFVTVNVAGLDDNLFTDSLFGHAKGAFTGAIGERPGLIESAADGTLFLDEIGDMSAASQVKLLRLLQEHEYYPVGSDERKLSNARIVTATHSNLEERVAAGDFRQDLYYRLCIHQVNVLPLRERLDDLPLLIGYFVRQAADELGILPPQLPDTVIDELSTRRFPGNVRELEGLIHDAVSRMRAAAPKTPAIAQEIVPEATAAPPEEPASGESRLAGFYSGEMPTLQEMTELMVREALERTDHNQTAAAKLLGISRQALNKRLRRSDDVGQ